MKKSLLFLAVMFVSAAFGGDCGPGYVLADHSKVDGLNTQECQKLWCQDLETGHVMGAGNRANSGYVSTASPIELCDVKGNCISCFGDRQWCSGVRPGVWNPEYGAYTRGGGDTAVYMSYQKGSCFMWRLEQPNCPDGQAAILQNDEWVCIVEEQNTTLSRSSAVRRTSTRRRGVRR